MAINEQVRIPVVTHIFYFAGKDKQIGYGISDFGELKNIGQSIYFNPIAYYFMLILPLPPE